jgi:sigma-E factor negative regulatory protein RseA
MKDKLSAFLDGELDDAEHASLLNATKKNDELMYAWQHYHLIGDAMRAQLMLDVQFQQRVMQKISDEPTVLAPALNQTHAQEPSNKRLPRQVWWSVAASVAAVFFVAWVVMQQQIPNQNFDISPQEIAQAEIPTEYLLAHQSYAPSAAYVQTINYADGR